MNLIQKDFPFNVLISFKKFFDSYKAYVNSDNSLQKERAKSILDIAKAYPVLEEGINTTEAIDKYQEQIDLVLQDAFSNILEQNEIKIATIPFSNIVLKSTQRYKNIIKAAGKDFEPVIKNMDESHFYIMGCSIVLGLYYGFNIDFKRPIFYDIPDAEGMMRYYRILYNADFIEVIKTEKSIDITEEDVNELLDNFDNIDLWREKFPPGSWLMKGIVLANMYDATAEASISEFKTSLLRFDKDNHDFVSQFQNVFRTIFNLPEIKVGFTNYNEEEKVFEQVPVSNMESYLLYNSDSLCCESALCGGSYNYVLDEKTYFPISNIEKMQKLYPEERLYKALNDQGIQSAIFAPISNEDQLLGVLELVSPNKYDLNSINANKLQDVIPYLLDSILQNRTKAEDELELIIQEECTSIHPSVYWKFKKEAKRFLKGRLEEKSVTFREIAFEEVYPLYGQIDIKGSSDARNKAIQQDLELQLLSIAKLIEEIQKVDEMPIYEQLKYQIEEHLKAVKNQLQVDSEQSILDFIKQEINPILPFLKTKNEALSKLVTAYTASLDPNIKMIYKYRKAYDESVMLINKKMANLLDKKQEDAQKMYPHYFERFKTDGVEHNMYIGESITQEDSFNKIYLYNLRLWQLQVMCEMENEYYQMQNELPLPLDVASMVLVFNTSLSVRFRMDEKRFDVDGTYNARYEVVKKRVDKANIKGTNKRITEKGKLVIVYSQKSDEIEYVNYIKFLQDKKYLDKEIEVVELDDLQGVTGLKALRVNILYHTKTNDKEYYTYEDLLNELN